MQTISSAKLVAQVNAPLPVSPQLMHQLEQLIPTRPVVPTMTQNEIMYEAGKQYVLDFLRKQVNKNADFDLP